MFQSTSSNLISSIVHLEVCVIISSFAYNKDTSVFQIINNFQQ